MTELACTHVETWQSLNEQHTFTAFGMTWNVYTLHTNNSWGVYLNLTKGVGGQISFKITLLGAGPVVVSKLRAVYGSDQWCWGFPQFSNKPIMESMYIILSLRHDALQGYFEL
jgi:hypothetical protein